MPDMSATRLSALVAAVLLSLSACSGGGDSEDGAAEPPPGGWPQPENGQLTAKMCGLLTPDDYEGLGHRQLLPLEEVSPLKPASNAVSCSAPPADSLALVLQPTAEAAKIFYQSSLTGRKQQVLGNERETILAENLVGGVDESWFDYWVDSGSDDARKDYELQFRRGALVVGLILSGVDEAKEKDPKGTLLKLAELVLGRIADLGRSDTGTTPKVHFEIQGKGEARSIRYDVPDGEATTLEGVKLPWKVDAPMADHGEQNLVLSLSATVDGYPPMPLSCAIVVDGKAVAQSQGRGIVNCLGNLPGR